MHECLWLKLEGLLKMPPDMHLLCLFGMNAISNGKKLRSYSQCKSGVTD